MITYHQASTLEELQQIHRLQKENLPANISSEELIAEGFVTVDHDLKLLQSMNEPHGHIIAKDGAKVIAYALIMLREFEKEISVLKAMFQQINAIHHEGQLLAHTTYFTMGQVCIAKGYRGSGIFKGLYAKMREVMSPHFTYVITEVAQRNPRSLRAHYKVGFQAIKEFTGDFGEKWVIILWDWT